MSDKHYISTLECPDLRSGRAVGNTTRQVDFAIQKLFEGYIVKCHDHYLCGTHSDANRFLCKTIIKRLGSELGIVTDSKISRRELKIDKSKFTLQII